MGSLMMISPLRILMLYRQEGLVQTHALYSIEAPWLPKSESGTRSPSLHLRQRGNAFSTISPPSFTPGGLYSPPHPKRHMVRRRKKPRGSLRRCIRVPTASTSLVLPAARFRSRTSARARSIPHFLSHVSMFMKFPSLFLWKICLSKGQTIHKHASTR